MPDPFRHDRDPDESLRTLAFVGIICIALIVAFATFLYSATRARAQTVCGPWQAVKAAFAKTYGEVPIGGGVTNNSRMVAVLASPEGKTFTIILVDQSGLACAIAAGKDWQPGKILDIGEQG